MDQEINTEQWYYGRLDMTDHIRLELTPASKQNVYKLKLLWQNMPNQTRTCLYSRYLTAKTFNGAKRQSIPAVSRWLGKQAVRPENISPHQMAALKACFGL